MRSRHGATCAGREGSPVKQFKDLNACIAQLQALCAGSDIKPEQKKNVEAAIERLRRLRRKPDAKMIDVYSSVREIADRLISAFLR
jgi:DNA repair ATPase RecN